MLSLWSWWEEIYGLLRELRSILTNRENEVCPKERAIADELTSKISRPSFVRNCDEGNISEKLAKNYWLVKEWWSWLDEIAQSASFNFWGWRGQWDEISVENVVEFMNIKYRGWRREYIRINCTEKAKPIVEALKGHWVYFNFTKSHKKILWELLSWYNLGLKEDDDEVPF